MESAGPSPSTSPTAIAVAPTVSPGSTAAALKRMALDGDPSGSLPVRSNALGMRTIAFAASLGSVHARHSSELTFLKR